MKEEHTIIEKKMGEALRNLPLYKVLLKQNRRNEAKQSLIFVLFNF